METNRQSHGVSESIENKHQVHGGIGSGASARRRLIRGVFATPAVLALHSGSALAVTSSLRCLSNQDASGIYPGWSTGPDMYVRVQLYAQPPAVETAEPAWYLSGSSIEAARGTKMNKVLNYSSLKAGEWQPVALDASGKVSYAGDKLLSPPPNVALGPRYVAVRFDLATMDEVWIRGVVDGGVDGTAVSGSCWTSFAVK
jgi:hypothetical protein